MLNKPQKNNNETTPGRPSKPNESNFHGSPRILRIIKAIQRTLVTSGLCLSNLYSISPDLVCENYQVDSHFYAQLENFYRDQMWSTLETEFTLMNAHYEQTKEVLEYI